jgi:tryptophanyl-tRNA synthetase
MLASGLEGKKKRVVSGMRPTGKLHIGHYFGALQNWVRLQNDSTYECFYFIADWHALTSDYADTSGVAQNTIEIVTDYLAAGLDPQKSIIFQQSPSPNTRSCICCSPWSPLGWLSASPPSKALENVRQRPAQLRFWAIPFSVCRHRNYSSSDIASLWVPLVKTKSPTSNQPRNRQAIQFGLWRANFSILDRH